MAVEKTMSAAEQPESPEAAAVRELLKLLVKAQKARRLYQAKNAISDRLQTELFLKLSSHFDERGSFTLIIREFRIMLGEDLVYESHDRNDSLAFLLFRDGIRRLSFHPGLQENELQDFLKCLNRVALLSNEQDDLVTLFWDADFKSIKYFAVEELSTETDGPRLEEQLSSGTSDGERGSGAAPDAADLEDIEQPVSHLPVEACSLKEHEIEALRAELAREEQDPFGIAVVELAIDLTLLEPGREQRKELAKNTTDIFNRLLANEDLEAVVQAFEHMSGLAEMAFQSNEKVQDLYRSLTQSLAESQHLEQFLEHVESHRSVKPHQITAYLARLGKIALPELVAWMGRMGTAAHRRGVTDAVLANEAENALEELARHLPPLRDTLDAAFTREALYLLTNLPAEQTFPLVQNLLSSSHAATRREAIQVLGRFPDRQIDPICLRLLGDGDLEVRSTALDILVRSGRPELAEPILDHTTRARGFDDRGLSEKRRIFAAVAKLGGPGSLDWFVEMLSQEGRKWFASRREREAREAVVHGIRIVGTDEARQLLRKMAETGDRHVRTACLKELAAERGIS